MPHLLVLLQPGQGDSFVEKVVAQRSRLVLALQRAVPVVLDRIVGAPGQSLGNVGPLVAMQLQQNTAFSPDARAAHRLALGTHIRSKQCAALCMLEG